MSEQVIGTKFFSQSLVPNSSATVFAASANVNGATIRTIALWATNNAVVTIEANYPDGTNRPIFIVLATPAQNTFGNQWQSLRLPSNVGLSITTTMGGSSPSTALVSITYDLY
jgi:hypothetical protein